MALSPDLQSGLFRRTTFEIEAETSSTLPQSGLIFDCMDPRLNEMSKEERRTQYFARRLAAGNYDELRPKYKVSDYDPDNPNADILVSDPLSDPRIEEIASFLKAAGFKGEPGVDPIS